MLAGAVLVLAALSLVAYNLIQNAQVKKANDALIQSLEEKREPDKSALYRLYPDMDMPVVEIDGIQYIGTISIPSVELETPVLAEYDAKTMEVTPARYSGSAYQNNLLLLGHNYRSCFGKLASLEYGAELCFTDMNQNAFYYEVIDITTISGDAFDEILSEEEDWDLTMFTCTWSGVDRVVIRCALIKDVPAQMNQNG